MINSDTVSVSLHVKLAGSNWLVTTKIVTLVCSLSYAVLTLVSHHEDLGK